MRRTVISLCDLTGNMVAPWVAAGYHAVLVDPQHTSGDEEGIRRVADTVEGAADYLGDLVRDSWIAAVFAFPPCTDLAVSGARWFASKYARDPLFQARSVAVADQCRMVGMLSGAPWLVEQPIGVLSRVWGPASHLFDPCDYAGWESADHYRKRTCLWTGGGFVMPPARPAPELGAPDMNRVLMHGPGPERRNLRGATPHGFARAVFAANR